MKRYVKYDEEMDIAYVHLSENKIERSILTDDELFVRDYDEAGNLVGIEILSVRRLLHKAGYEQLSQDFKIEEIPLYLLGDQSIFSVYQSK